MLVKIEIFMWYLRAGKQYLDANLFDYLDKNGFTTKQPFIIHAGNSLIV